MILADTSVWVDHLRVGNRRFAKLLDSGIGELALGRLRQRENHSGSSITASPTPSWPRTQKSSHFIDCYAVFGRGIGYVDVDVHLFAAVRLTANLWTHDQRLLSAATTAFMDRFQCRARSENAVKCLFDRTASHARA